MMTNQVDFYDRAYSRVPMNSATTRRDTNDFNSFVESFECNTWPTSLKHALTTTYIDGTAMLGQNHHSSFLKDLFPKGKNRPKPLKSTDKKMTTRVSYMSLLPIDTATTQALRLRSPLSTTTGKRYSSLPEVPHKNCNIQRKTYGGSVVLEENSSSKLYARCATTRGSGGWVRRYKSINTSLTFIDLLREQPLPDKILLKKRPGQQVATVSSSSSSSSSNNSFLIKNK